MSHIFKEMRNFECSLQCAYDEMIEILVMLEKVEHDSNTQSILDNLNENPEDAFEGISSFLLSVKSILLEKGLECTEEDIIRFLIRRKLGRI